MPNLHDLLRAARRVPGQAFELDVGEEHLPPELEVLANSFRFVPVDEDPFEDPKDRAEREAKEKATKAKKAGP